MITILSIERYRDGGSIEITSLINKKKYTHFVDFSINTKKKGIWHKGDANKNELETDTDLIREIAKELMYQGYMIYDVLKYLDRNKNIQPLLKM